MRKFRILLPYLGRWDQPSKSRFHQIAERLARNGCVVHVIQAPPLESEEITFQQRNIELHQHIKLHTIKLNKRIWTHARLGKILRKGYYGFGVTRMVKRLIREFSIDALWLYNLPHYPLFKIRNCIIIFDYVDDYIAMLRTEAKLLNSTITELIAEAFLKDLLRRSDIIFCVSEILHHHVTELIGESKSLILPNGVDAGVFSSTDSKNSDPVSISQENATVGFVGAFEYFIDFDMIFEAARRLPRVRFLLVGGGRQYEYLKKVKECEKLNNIHFTGFVDSEEVPQYISKMDICLHSFKRTRVSHAACPMKLFEYLALGKPVITSTLEEVTNIDEGFLYYADTAKELVEQIKGILRCYQKAVEKTSKAKPIIVKKYNWDLIAEQFADTVEVHL